MGCLFDSGDDAEARKPLKECDNTGQEHIHARRTDSSSDQDYNSDTYQSLTEDGNTKSRYYMCWGYFLAVLAILVGATSIVMVQLLNRLLPHSELNGLRFLFACGVCTTHLLVKKCDLTLVTVPKTDAKWILVLALFRTVASYGYGEAYYLPVSLAAGLTISLQVLINFVLKYVIVKVLLWTELLASAVCLVGIVLVLQPAFLFHEVLPPLITPSDPYQTPCTVLEVNVTDASVNNGTSVYARDDRRDQVYIGYILCIVEAVAVVGMYNVTRYKLTEVKVFAVIFWVSLFGTVFSFIVMSFTETPTMPRIPMCAVFLCVHLACAASEMFLSTSAGQRVHPLWISLIMMLYIPLTFVVQYSFLAGLFPGHANVVEFAGAALVLLGNILLPVSEIIRTYWT